MTRKENDHIYTTINVDKINDSMAEAMMELMKGNVTNGADLFHIVKESISPEELAYLVTIMVAERTHKSLKENPMIMLLASMARAQEQHQKKTDSKAQEDLLKTVNEILNKK